MMPEPAFGQVMDSAALLLGHFALPLLSGLCPCPTGKGFLPSHTLPRGGGDEGIQQLLCPPGGDETQEGEGGVTDRRDVAPKLPANPLQITIGFRDGFQLGILKMACFPRKMRIRV